MCDSVQCLQVRVCIVDTGVDWRNPDLAPNLWMNEKEVHGPGATAANGYQNGIDDDNDGDHPHCIAHRCISIFKLRHDAQVLCNFWQSLQSRLTMLT